MKIEIEVSDALGELAVGLGKLLGDCKQAFADGFQLGGDSAAILSSVLVNLVPQISKFQEIEDAAKADPSALALALAAEIKKALQAAPAAIEAPKEA